MRVIAITLALCSFALAQAGEVKDGKLTEKPWNLEDIVGLLSD